MPNILIWITSTKDTTRFFLIDWPSRNRNLNLKKRTKFSRPCLSNIWMVFQLMMRLSAIPIPFLSSTIKSTSEDFPLKEPKLPTLSWKVPESLNNTDFRILKFMFGIWCNNNNLKNKIECFCFVYSCSLFCCDPYYIYRDIFFVEFNKSKRDLCHSSGSFYFFLSYLD